MPFFSASVKSTIQLMPASMAAIPRRDLQSGAAGSGPTGSLSETGCCRPRATTSDRGVGEHPPARGKHPSDRCPCPRLALGADVGKLDHPVRQRLGLGHRLGRQVARLSGVSTRATHAARGRSKRSTSWRHATGRPLRRRRRATCAPRSVPPRELGVRQLRLVRVDVNLIGVHADLRSEPPSAAERSGSRDGRAGGAAVRRAERQRRRQVGIDGDRRHRRGGVDEPSWSWAGHGRISVAWMATRTGRCLVMWAMCAELRPQMPFTGCDGFSAIDVTGRWVSAPSAAASAGDVPPVQIVPRIEGGYSPVRRGRMDRRRGRSAVRSAAAGRRRTNPASAAPESSVRSKPTKVTSGSSVPRKIGVSPAAVRCPPESLSPAFACRRAARP